MSLHTRYRPQYLDDVIGQDTVVKALTSVIERNEAQAFLFCGPSGVGKTTLARITAAELGCDHSLIEIDAATNTGVEDMRKVQEVLQYRPFGKAKRRGILIDEVHRLSGNAWDSLLKIIEEPPASALWLLCTTNPAKVPQTIKTRCITLTLKAVEDEQLGELYDKVCEAEKIDLPGDVSDLIIQEAQGSPRQMLVNLELCREAKNRKEAAQLLRSAIGSDATLALCRFLMNPGSWVSAMEIIEKLEDTNPEGVRIRVVNYLAAVLRKAKSDDDAMRVLTIMDAFAEPYIHSENTAPLLRSVGRSMFATE